MRERLRIALPARVKGREAGDREWAEMSRVVNVTPFGARLRLARPTEVGRILHLTLAMPRQFRAFDHAEDQYRVWCLVRNVKLLDPEKEKGALVEIGVAFIGKTPPESYKNHPERRYEIAQTKLEAGFWDRKEGSAGQMTEVTSSSSDKRKESRQLIPVEVVVEVFRDNELVASEDSVTENISRRGASVFTAMDVMPGTFVKVSSERYGARVLGVVRGRRKGPEGITRLHIEFVGSEWPLPDEPF